jgi:hypothetical protein
MNAAVKNPLSVTNKEIWQISYPIIFGNLAQTIMVFVNTVFIGHVGNVELGAVMLGGIYYLVFTALAMGFAIGVQIIIARRFGEQNYKQIGVVFEHGLLFTTILGLTLWVVMHFFSDILPQNGKDWVVASQKVLELQALWKTIGMVPTAVNTEIYERFRASCNKFFELKKEYFDRMNSDLEENLRKKTELCVTAESLQDSTDWKKTTEMFYDLQRKWKEIGPAPKKHSDQIWGRFRAACNKFFDAKSQFYSNIEAEHQMNLEKKENLISEVKAYVPVEDQAQNVEKIKEFRTRWNEIGYVASADKDRLYKEFKEAVDKIFATINLNRNDLELSAFNTQIEMIKESGEVSALQKERSAIVHKIQDLTVEIAQIENNLGFFSSGSDSIVKEFKKKIEKIKNEIAVLKDKKKAIDIAERELKGTSNE